MEVIIDNVSEFDAKAADRIITEYNSLLDEATLKDMHISAVLAAMEENGGVNVDALLKRAQDYVRKLKSNFLELETKVRFLDAIAGSTDRQSIHVSDEMFAETEISVAHAKNKLKKSKASCAVERSQLEDTITEVAQCYEDYESTSRISRAKLHALATLVEAQKAQKAADAFLYTEDASQMEEFYGHLERIEEDGVRVMIDTETEKIRAMESELKTLESEDSKLTSTLQSSEEELLALRDVVTDLGKSVEEKEGQDSRRVRLREISASHAKVDETVSNLTGVKVIDATTRRATMNIQIKDKPHLYQLTLLFARDGSGIESVNLHPDVLRVDPADLRNRSLCAAVAEIINRLETVK